MSSNPASQRTTAARRRLFRGWHVEATAFLYEIVRTADALQEAKAFDGEPAMYFGARWRLLRAIERCGGAPTFSHLARALRISRQAAREGAVNAQFSWAFTLLKGLDDQAMREASHVLEVIRRRLERYASEMRAARRAARG
jgi:hypothetical protein